MFILPYTGHGRDEAGSARAARFSLSGALRLMRETAANPTILSMILLGGATSLLVGNAFQAQMPEFAHDFGHDQQDWAYSMLLAANAAGSVVGGLLLEGTGLLEAERAQRGDLLDALVWGHHRFRCFHELSAGDCVAFLCGLSQFDVSFHGADSGAARSAGPTAWPVDRSVQYVAQWSQGFQRRHGGSDRRTDRNSLVAGHQRHDIVGRNRSVIRIGYSRTRKRGI